MLQEFEFHKTFTSNLFSESWEMIEFIDLIAQEVPYSKRSVYLPGWPGHTSAKWPLRTRVGHVVYPGTEQHFHSSVLGWAHPGTEAGVRMRRDMFRNITLLLRYVP